MVINDCFLLFCVIYIATAQQDTELCQRVEKISNFDGKFILTGLFPVISSIPSRFQYHGLLLAEAMQFAVNEVNRRILQNDTKLGYVMYDTCSEGQLDMTVKVILDILLDKPHKMKKVIKEGTCLCQYDNVNYIYLGSVGPASSSNTIQVNELLSTYEVPILSYLSTSSELSAKQNCIDISSERYHLIKFLHKS